MHTAGQATARDTRAARAASAGPPPVRDSEHPRTRPLPSGTGRQTGRENLAVLASRSACRPLPCHVLAVAAHPFHFHHDPAAGCASRRLFFFRWNGRHGSTRMVELITDRQRSFDSVTMDPVAVAYYHMSVYAHGTSIKSECREKRRKKVLEPPYASYSYAFPQNKFLSPLQADCLENEILFYFCVFSVIFSCFLI